jgi:type IV pilus assembly protein PilA
MKTSISIKKSGKKGFTLIEMIGVLAIIGVLAALLIPKIFAAIDTSRVNSSASSMESVKTAVAQHYAKYLSLTNNGANINVTTPYTNYDTMLLTEGFMDKLLSIKIASAPDTQVNYASIGAVTATTPVTAGGTVTAVGDVAFDLVDVNTNTSPTSSITGSEEIVVTLENVLVADAKALNDLIDGPTQGATSLGTSDLWGRVKYSTPASGLVNVSVYIMSH